MAVLREDPDAGGQESEGGQGGQGGQGGNRPPGGWKRPGPGVVALLTGAFVVVLLLRHDYWNWGTARPLFLGFIPVGLWWQMLVSLAASGLMWLMVRLAWPGWLEDEALEAERNRTREGGGTGT